MTEFDRKAYYQLKKWWDDNGNPDISIWDDEFGYIIFEDKPTHRLVAKVMHFGPKGWAFERYWESYPITKAERKQIDKFVKRCNDRRFRQTLTYHDFFVAFNRIDSDHHACADLHGGAIISDGEGYLIADLAAGSCIWHFEKSGLGCDELVLMANLSAALAGLRGGINDDQN